MTNKKHTNPIMTPEWFASLTDVCVVPDTSASLTDDQVAALVKEAKGLDSVDWRTEPVLLSLSILLQSLGRGNFEQARQETQTINRCLAVGASPDPVLLARMLRDLIG